MSEFYVGPASERQVAALTGGLNRARISSRKQGGRDLSYLEAWDVKATLIRIFGFGGFSADCINTEVLEILKEPAKDSKGNEYIKVTSCALATVRLHIKQFDCTYTESAVASQTGRDIGEVTDFAVKTAESDALKRAAIYLGTQFGLSLYDSGSTNDVVRVILAPGQEYEKDAAPSQEQAEALKNSLGAQ